MELPSPIEEPTMDVMQAEEDHEAQPICRHVRRAADLLGKRWSTQIVLAMLDGMAKAASLVAPPLLRVALALPFLRSGLTRWDGFLSLSAGTVFLFEEQFKLQYYFGGKSIYTLRSPEGMVVVPIPERLRGTPGLRYLLLTPEERTRACRTFPPPWDDDVAEILSS